ncbi:tail fiber protein [Xenorhabdus stockiae]|uniref:Tail fiber protein n=1 Tax=Xenorhabdus stockiae TaxID=351614 RepID=A0A2D0KLF9_9GAMM|nr:tail fiber protein [Xenorhabdus stockiae]PHM64236.1 tail fiber protein [Xenorhabdus stockiae]
MQKIGDITNTADSHGEFTNGNVAAGIPPTLLEAEWFNTLQREIINVLSKAGIKLNKNNDVQLAEAISQIIFNGALEKAQNGADIPDKPTFVKHLNFIEQQTGASTTTVMSQQAVTNAITHATPDASTTQKGVVQLTSSRVSSSEAHAATANAVAQNYNDIRALQEKTSDASTTQRGLVQLSDSRTLFSSSVAATSLAASQNYMDMRGMLGNIGKTGRELGVTYESKQGFAVFVHVDGISSTGSNFLSAVVNDVNFRGSMCAPLANQRIAISFMIPAGATYSVWQHSGVVTDLVWVETDKR